VDILPKELHNSEEFEKHIAKAMELRVVRAKDNVKLKLRTPEYLYTFKTTEDEAEGIIKKAKDLEVIEIGQKKEEAEKKETKEDQKKSD
jgi:hypothetical protein